MPLIAVADRVLHQLGQASDLDDHDEKDRARVSDIVRVGLRLE